MAVSWKAYHVVGETSAQPSQLGDVSRSALLIAGTNGLDSDKVSVPISRPG